MRQTRAGHYRPVPKLATLVPKDFDQIEEAESECIREIMHGHSFSADGMTEKPSHGRIYSL